MKTYIINLKRSPERKVYMEDILKDLSWLQYEFVAAVDGKAMSDNECEEYFNTGKFKSRYSRNVRPGEIGCTLSHQKCYRKIVNDDEPYVLILEDDILRPSTDFEFVIKNIENVISTEVPQIILLSGWYWFNGTFELTSKYKIVNVFEALLTHAYIINKPAARILMEERPYITADDWRYIRRKGIKLQAVYPHLIDQNWDGSLPTTVNIGEKKQGIIRWYFFNAFRLVYMKFLKVIGHFERP